MNTTKFDSQKDHFRLRNLVACLEFKTANSISFSVVALVSLTSQRKLLQLENKEEERQAAIAAAKRALAMGLEPRREQWLKDMLGKNEDDS